MWFFRKYTIDKVQYTISRDELLRRSRILIVDDELPELINDLKAAHFSVDYVPDITSGNMDYIDRPIYDLILLDFGNVGKSFGSDEGLSLLRHIKRLNPSVIVLAYTSKSLGIAQADFYRISDGVLSKDAGISESLEKIEEGLRKAHSPENLWRGIITIAGVTPGSEEDKNWQNLFMHGIRKKKYINSLKEKVTTTLGGNGAQKVGLVILEKLIELSIKYYISG